MNSSVSIALCLAASDIEALVQGQMIAALSRTFINSAQNFALYPADLSANDSSSVSIQAWAKLEMCRVHNVSQDLEKLSRITIWSNEVLQNILKERGRVFLACLRVYKLLQPIEVLVKQNNSNRMGNFIKLPNHLAVSNAQPILSEAVYQKRLRQLIKLDPPFHPELEDLESKVVDLSATYPPAKLLNHNLRTLLGWSTQPTLKEFSPKLSWISLINTVGTAENCNGIYSSQDKGAAFERIVHKSLDFLGFEVDPCAEGGSGGLDLFCKKPYSLVGECKSGQSIPADTVHELDRLKDFRLNGYEPDIKLIIGPGTPFRQIRKLAQIRNISIIKPMTLQKLVELQARFPGSIDLIALKDYLTFGQTDDEVKKYLEKVNEDIDLRSDLVELVKKYLINTDTQDIEFGVLYGAYAASRSNPLKQTEIHEILIELCSPLVGHLGRIRGNDWRSDRFYFLRELPAVQRIPEIVFLLEEVDSPDGGQKYKAKALGQPLVVCGESMKALGYPLVARGESMKALYEDVRIKVLEIFPDEKTRPKFAFYLRTVGDEVVVFTSKIEA